MATMKSAYVATNAVWPDTLPELTDWEAVRAVARLWRFGMGEACPYPIEAHGKKNTWLWHGTIKVAYRSGWKELVHDLGHLMWWKANPGEKPHSKAHARFETKLAKEVLKRGWLNGKLKKVEPVKTVTHERVVKLERIEAAMKRWESKRKRAENALKKLRRQKKYYESRLAA